MTDEHDSQSARPVDQKDQGSEQQPNDEPKSALTGCLIVAVKTILGGIVLIVVAIALVFGVCLLGAG